MGIQIRRQRRRLGLTLDDLSRRSEISKPYLSLIETGRINNPPSDEKLRRLELALGFKTGELLAQAHFLRTPKDVRAMLVMLANSSEKSGEKSEKDSKESSEKKSSGNGSHGRSPGAKNPETSRLDAINLDQAYLTGMLQQLVDQRAGNVEMMGTNVLPVVNRVSAGYPKDFTDLSYPKGAADSYISCPEVSDPDAFAARVHGDSMTPKYREGDIVIFSPKATLRSGDDAFIRFEDGQTTFKRVFFESDDANQPVIRLQPRNEKYRAQLIPNHKISGLYRAVYRYQAVEEN